jgi:osmotically-inducible protein OsmY
MSEKQEVIKAVKAAFEHEPRINLHSHPLHIDFEDGVLTLEGDVENIAAKKLGLELAIVVPGVTGIVDRLHVMPAMPMGDGAVLDAVRNALLEEPALRECTIRIRQKGKEETIRESLSPNPGVIELSVNNGVVLLDNHVRSLGQKRLAGVLAWWVPGSRDVINGMAVEPLEEDNDEEISEAVRLVLEKDRLVNADQIRVKTHDAVVTLGGLVRNEREKHMAEFNAWYVFGVDKVVNTLGVQE